MNKNNLVKILKQELTILADFINGFNDSENIHPMEVDLALSKVKDIYNELLLLKDSDSLTGADFFKNKTLVEHAAHQSAIEEPNVEEPNIKNEELDELDGDLQTEPEEEEKTEVLLENRPPLEQEIITEELFDEGHEQPEQIFEESSSLPEVEGPDENEITEQVNNEATQKTESKEPIAEPADVNDNDKKIKSGIIADKFSKNSPSVNDMMAGIKKNKDLASYLKAGPIKDLKKAIKLNDRIWYINELFNKNATQYEKSVDVINRFDNLDQALEYIFTNFTWDQSRKSTISFLELVFRRYAAN